MTWPHHSTTLSLAPGHDTTTHASKMSVDTCWDIESYRAPYESDEHWALKREFMEAHKDRIPEVRLICLAQVFVNIELLGCR